MSFIAFKKSLKHYLLACFFLPSKKLEKIIETQKINSIKIFVLS